MSQASDFIVMTTAPIVDELDNAVLHFLVPHTHIDKKFNQIMLFSAGASEDSEYMASVVLTEIKNGSEVFKSVEKGDSNMVYVLDWYMRADNI